MQVPRHARSAVRSCQNSAGLAGSDEITRSKVRCSGQLRRNTRRGFSWARGTTTEGGVHEELDVDSDDRGAGAIAGGLRDGEGQPHELGEDVPGARRHLRLDRADVFEQGIAEV